MNTNGFFSRKEPRLQLNLTAEYKESSSDADTYLPSLLKSVSIGSFDMETSAELSPDTVISIRFQIPAEDDVAQVLCQVVRCVKNKSGKTWKSGLKIIEMNKDSQSMLSSYIDSLGYYGWYYR